jgi:hypothetical protein
MSDTAERDPELLEGEPEPEPTHAGPDPLVQCYMLDGDYAGATLSLAGDPDGNHMAERVKCRYIIAADVPSLQPQIIACLIADFGLHQDEAEELVPVWLVAGEPPPPPETEEPLPEEQPDAPTHQPAEQDEPTTDMYRSWDSPQREA